MRWIEKIGGAALLAVAATTTLFPVYWLATLSLKREVDQFAVPPIWFRFTPTLAHYYDVFWVRPFGAYLWHSTIAAGVSTLLALAVGTAAAYSLARFPRPGVAFWILSTRMFPPIVSIIPLFLMLRWVNLLNSIAALVVLYTAFNLPFVVWMMRGFFEELPADLEEAAMLDGQTRLGALWKVVLPLVRPGLAATAAFCLVIGWNEFLFALIVAQTDVAMTLPVGIAGRVTQYEIKWGAMSAAGVVAMLPVFVFASFLQKYLVRGLSLGAVKG
ncbi:MAG: carbohydrate ABC transporter permease [Acidobacteria bacterium]|nr:carbohydrate ABC transporter permease [Acidobacteriota bacterium]